MKYCPNCHLSYDDNASVCGRCGSAMTAVQGRSRLYLICGGKKRGICGGAGAVWTVQAAEELVGRVLAERLERLQAAGGVRQDSRDMHLRQKLDAAVLRREMLLQCMTEAEDPGTVRAAAEAAARLDAQCSVWREQLATAEKPLPAVLPEWDLLSAEEKKQAAQLLLRCVIAEGSELHVILC